MTREYYLGSAGCKKIVEQQRCDKHGCVRVGTQVMWIEMMSFLSMLQE